MRWAGCCAALPGPLASHKHDLATLTLNARLATPVRVFLREPTLGLTAFVLVGLMALFIVYPQIRVITVPGLGGYEAFFRQGPNWIRATQNSLWTMAFGTTTA